MSTRVEYERGHGRAVAKKKKMEFLKNTMSYYKVSAPPPFQTTSHHPHLESGEVGLPLRLAHPVHLAEALLEGNLTAAFAAPGRALRPRRNWSVLAVQPLDASSSLAALAVGMQV